MKAPTISVIVKKMAAEGLLTHEVHLSDLRAVRLHLTEKGRLAHESTHKALRSTDEIMMDGFTQEETDQLKALLNRVRDNLLADLESKGLLHGTPSECTHKEDDQT